MGRIRVLVVDEHRIFAESLATVLTAEPDIEASSAGSRAAASRLMERTLSEGGGFDVLLVDIDADSAEGDPGTGSDRGASRQSSLLETVSERFPETRVVMLAARDDPLRAARALSAGASGWVDKDSSLARLVQVVRGVLKDETHVAPALLTGVLSELTRDQRHRGEHQRLVESLTPREREVLRCMLAGLGRKAVAERLYLSPHTVRTHMQNVLGKLGVHSTLAAVALARRAGVSPAD